MTEEVQDRAAHLPVLFHKGPLPKYLLATLDRLNEISPQRPVLLTDQSQAAASQACVIDLRDLTLSADESDYLARTHARLTYGTWRDSLWTSSAARFAYLSAFQRDTRADLVHLEGDYLILDPGLFRIDPAFLGRVAMTRHSLDSMIAGICFFPGPDSTGELLRYLSLATDSANEMQALDRAYRIQDPYSGWRYLPTLPRQVNAPDPDIVPLRGILDAAAIGQFVGGVDPRNTRGLRRLGYVNSGADLDMKAAKVVWAAEGDGELRLQVDGVDPTPILGLHVHSKDRQLLRNPQKRIPRLLHRHETRRFASVPDWPSVADLATKRLPWELSRRLTRRSGT